jgi:hypothetical protein
VEFFMMLAAQWRCEPSNMPSTTDVVSLDVRGTTAQAALKYLAPMFVALRVRALASARTFHSAPPLNVE